MKFTSATANKLLKKLNEQKAHVIATETARMDYVCSDGETPIVPKYSYEDTTATIAAIDAKVVKIKHAINKVNVTETIDVNGVAMTIDAVLVRMAQLTLRKAKLDTMRSMEPKKRVNSRGFGTSSSVVEYRYANFDIDKVASDYDAIDNEITTIQLALDKFNQTFEFEVDIEL